jgi:aminopeptidase N
MIRRTLAPAVCTLFVVALAVARPTAVVAAEHEHVCRYCQRAAAAAAANSLAVADPHAAHEPGKRQYAPDRVADVLHIKLDVTPDFAQHTVSGTATIRFKPIAKPLKKLTLDGVNLDVSAVRPSHALQQKFSYDGKQLTIVFKQPIPVGEEATVEIDYSAEPKLGLFFRTPEMGYPESDTHVWTQGEPHEARHWFPCFDYPNERASTEIIFHVPVDMTVLSNGRQVGETVAADGKTKAVHWLQEKPHVSYLMAVVAGKLAKLEGQHRDVPLGFYTQPSKAKYAANAFRDTADIMEFFEAEIGVPFPWEKYDQATCGDFTWGGMENTTLTTLAQRTIASDATENIRTSYSLDAHEMAHQWFGDYVTCKDWSHLWLNEGFATYYSLLYEGHKFGRDTLLYGLYLDARDDVLSKENDRRPIVYRQYQHPDDQFDFRNYPKASWVLHMLRHKVGDDVYRQAIRTYLERHALGDVVTEDLREVFEELSGQPLDKFFDQWLYHGGFPELKVTYKWLPEEQLAHMTVEQTQQTGDAVLLFDLSSKLRFIVDGEAIDEPITIDGKKHDFYVRLPGEPTIALFDPEFTLLAKTTFDKPDKMLTAQLQYEPNVIARVQACEGLAERHTHAAVDALKQALQNDPFYGVRSAAATALRKIRTEEAVAALIASTEQEDARVRWRVVEELGKCYRDDAREKLLAVVAEEKNPAIVGAAVRGLGYFPGEASKKAIREALARQSWTNDETAAAFTAIRTLNDGSLAADLMETLKSRKGEIDVRDLSEGMLTLAKISPRGKRQKAAFNFLAGMLNNPREAVRAAAVRALGELKDPAARELLEPLAADEGDEAMSIAAIAALRSLDGQTPLVPQEVGELRRELRELRESQDKLEKSIDEVKSKSAAGKNGKAGETAKKKSDQH